MRKPKVLYITYNGVDEDIFQSQCLPYLKGLSKQGYDITLLSYERNIAANLKYKDCIKDLGIRWFSLKYHKWPRVIATSYDFLLGILVSLFITLNKKITIIHARATHGAVIGVVAAKLLGRKMIFDTRGLDSEEYVDGNLIVKNSFLHRIIFYFEKCLFSQTDSIVLLSSSARALLKEKGLARYIDESHTYVIPCATDLDLFKFKDDKTYKETDGIKLIYVGSVGTWYMIDEMLDLFMALKSRLKSSTFAIFTQSDRGIIYEKVERLRIKDCVKIDSADHNSIPQHMSDADAGICFVRPVSSKRASSPTKIGEYLASGLPIIINSGIGDMEELVRANRVGVVIDDFALPYYDKGIDELEGLMAEDDIFNRCRLTAERYFSLTDAIDKYDIIYKKLSGEI